MLTALSRNQRSLDEDERQALSAQHCLQALSGMLLILHTCAVVVAVHCRQTVQTARNHFSSALDIATVGSPRLFYIAQHAG